MPIQNIEFLSRHRIIAFRMYTMPKADRENRPRCHIDNNEGSDQLQPVTPFLF